MVASVENTARKYMEVRKALLRAVRQHGTFHVHTKNAWTRIQVTNNIMNALNNAHEEPTTLNQAIAYFTVAPPERRASITSAYNRLPQLHGELNAVAHKIMAIRRIQAQWIKARQGIRNKRRVSALLTLNKKGSVPNTARRIMNMTFPKPVYGPMTEMNMFKSRRKYSTY